MKEASENEILFSDAILLCFDFNLKLFFCLFLVPKTSDQAGSKPFGASPVKR